MRGYREGKGRDAGDIKNADEKEEELSLRGIRKRRRERRKTQALFQNL